MPAVINKSIVALLQKFGTNAIGLSGADGDIVPATRRSPYPMILVLWETSIPKTSIFHFLRVFSVEELLPYSVQLLMTETVRCSIPMRIPWHPAWPLPFREITPPSWYIALKKRSTF